MVYGGIRVIGFGFGVQGLVHFRLEQWSGARVDGQECTWLETVETKRVDGKTQNPVAQTLNLKTQNPKPTSTDPVKFVHLLP